MIALYSCELIWVYTYGVHKFGVRKFWISVWQFQSPSPIFWYPYLFRQLLKRLHIWYTNLFLPHSQTTPDSSPFIIIIINDSIYPAVSKASRTGNKVSCQPNDCPNRSVFKRRLKMASDGAETMSAGRSYQTRGATAPKARSPIAVVSASRPCLPTVGLSPGSSVQSGCDSGTQERPDET